MSDIPRNKPRLPWHDVALSVKGECVKDFCHHFIEYWNFASYQAHKLGRLVLVSRSSKAIDQEDENNEYTISKKEKVKNFLKDQIEKVNNYFKDKFGQKEDNEDNGNENLETSKPICRNENMKKMEIEEDDLEL